MKVILTQEVKGKGGEGDVIDVARGFAVNFLFPRKMALEATSGNLKQLELRKHNISTREKGRLGDAQSIADALEGKKVTIFAKVGEGGRLYGSITPQMIEDAISEQLDVVVDRRKMDVHGHIKAIGEHSVSVTVYRDIKAHVNVAVLAEGTEAVEAVAEEPVAEAEAEAEAVEVVAELVEEAGETVDEDADEA